MRRAHTNRSLSPFFSPQPHFELNTVLPAMVIGELLDPPAHFTATAGWSKALFAGDKSSAETIAPRKSFASLALQKHC